MSRRRAGAARVAAALTGLALTGAVLTGCTAPAAEEAQPPASSTPSAAVQPVGAVTLPEGATAAVRWTDEVGAVEPQTVRLQGEPLYITVSVACDTADAEVTVEIDGLFASGSSCYYDESTTRGPGGGGNTATMQVAVDRDATVSVTAEPADARWSGAVSTG